MWNNSGKWIQIESEKDVEVLRELAESRGAAQAFDGEYFREHIEKAPQALVFARVEGGGFYNGAEGNHRAYLINDFTGRACWFVESPCFSEGNWVDRDFFVEPGQWFLPIPPAPCKWEDWEEEEED
jgi:hypothetical protein